MTSPGPDWVEQARRFVVSSGLAEALGGAGPSADGPSPGTPPAADHGAECRWCPVCAGLAALRGRRPDLLEGLADLLGTAAAALRAQAATGTTGAAPPEPADDETTPGPPPAPVQRIDVA